MKRSQKLELNSRLKNINTSNFSFEQKREKKVGFFTIIRWINNIK